MAPYSAPRFHSIDAHANTQLVLIEQHQSEMRRMAAEIRLARQLRQAERPRHSTRLADLIAAVRGRLTAWSRDARPEYTAATKE